MNTKSGVEAMDGAGVPTADARAERNASRLQAFRAKYEAMLNVVEFVAAFEYLQGGHGKQGKSRAELEALIADARTRVRDCGSGGNDCRTRG